MWVQGVPIMGTMQAAPTSAILLFRFSQSRMFGDLPSKSSSAPHTAGR